MWTSAVLQYLSVTTMPNVRTRVDPIGVHVMLDLPAMEKHALVREYEIKLSFSWILDGIPVRWTRDANLLRELFFFRARSLRHE